MVLTTMAEVDTATLSRPKGTIVIYMQLSDAAAASAFYQRAFGAQEKNRLLHPDGKRIIHCHLWLNEGSVMLNDPVPDQRMPLETPQAFTLTLRADDIDDWCKRAVHACCNVIAPASTMVSRDRCCALKC